MMADERPSIEVHLSEELTEAQLAEVLYGIEEEGIPYIVRRVPRSGVAAAAHAAAIASRLGVGVGAAGGEIAITTEKLPPGQPYIIHSLNRTPASDRAIGTNAARIVKRIPLRPLGTT